MKLKNILLCAMVALALAPTAIFAKGPHFSFSVNMFTPRPYIVHPCPPPAVVYYYPHCVYPYPYVPYILHPGFNQSFSFSVGR